MGIEGKKLADPILLTLGIYFLTCYSYIRSLYIANIYFEKFIIGRLLSNKQIPSLIDRYLLTQKDVKKT